MCEEEANDFNIMLPLSPTTLYRIDISEKEKWINLLRRVKWCRCAPFVVRSFGARLAPTNVVYTGKVSTQYIDCYMLYVFKLCKLWVLLVCVTECSASGRI